MDLVDLKALKVGKRDNTCIVSLITGSPSGNKDEHRE